MPFWLKCGSREFFFSGPCSCRPLRPWCCRSGNRAPDGGGESIGVRTPGHRRCSSAGVTWDAGHHAFEETYGPEDSNTVYVSGFGAREGEPSFREAQDSIPIATLAAQLGISEQAVREYLIHALGGSTTADGAGALGRSASR